MECVSVSAMGGIFGLMLAICDEAFLIGIAETKEMLMKQNTMKREVNCIISVKVAV